MNAPRFRVVPGGRDSGAGVEIPGGPPNPPDMEARVAVLEQIAKTTSETLKEIKDDLRALRTKVDGMENSTRNRFESARDLHERDFRILFGVIITVALALAGLLAKGFHWL